MKLKEYTHKYNLKLSDLSRLLGLKSRSTLHRYVNEERIPAPNIMSRIVKVTNGEVQPEDFWEEVSQMPSSYLEKVELDSVDYQKGIIKEIYHDGKQIDLSKDETQNNDIFSEDNSWLVGNKRKPKKYLKKKKTLTYTDDGDETSPILRKASTLLGRRLQPKKNGLFLLDGNLVGMQQVICAANQVLSELGKKPIYYPGVNPVDANKFTQPQSF